MFRERRDAMHGAGGVADGALCMLAGLLDGLEASPDCVCR